MLVSGKNSCRVIIEKNLAIKEAFILESFNDNYFISELKKRKIKINYVAKIALNQLVSKNHQGIILSIEEFQYQDLEIICQENSFVVILDHIVDPQNLGAIIRSCEVFGVKAIIIPKNRSADINETVIRASAGAVFNIPIIRVTNLSQTIKMMKKNKYWIVGADVNGSEIETIDFKGSIGLIIGSEGFGLSQKIKEQCDFIVTISMLGKTGSLNASVSAGIIIYEAKKRRLNEI